MKFILKYLYRSVICLFYKTKKNPTYKKLENSRKKVIIFYSLFSDNKEVFSKCNDIDADDGNIEFEDAFESIGEIIDDFPCCRKIIFLLTGKEKFTKSAIKTKTAPKMNGGHGTKA